MDALTSAQRHLPMEIRMRWPDPTLRGLVAVADSIATAVEASLMVTSIGSPRHVQYGPSIALRRVSLNSPFELALGIHAGAVASASSLAVLIYALKRLSGLDLEIKTHRAELRQRLRQAEVRVSPAGFMTESSSLKDYLDERNREVAVALGDDNDPVPPEVVARIEEVRRTDLGTEGMAIIEDTAA